jgi:hypothetical protein
MADLNGFDANEIEPAGDFEPIPKGRYVAVIVDSELKTTKAGTGEYLELTFQITEGEFANRLLWARLNLKNPNPQAVKIARKDLSAICHAVRVLRPRDSSELHNLPLIVHVKLKKRSDTDEMVNEVKAFSAREAPSAGSSDDDGANSAPPWQGS